MSLFSWSLRDNAVARFAGLALPLALAVGCGSSDAPRLKTHPVSGKVTYAGENAVGAQVVLHSLSKEERKFAPVGNVGPDGTFKIESYATADGAPAGDYVATVAWFKVGEDGGRGPNVIPKKFGDRETSPFKITVKDGDNTLPIEIPK